MRLHLWRTNTESITRLTPQCTKTHLVDQRDTLRSSTPPEDTEIVLSSSSPARQRSRQSRSQSSFATTQTGLLTHPTETRGTRRVRALRADTIRLEGNHGQSSSKKRRHPYVGSQTTLTATRQEEREEEPSVLHVSSFYICQEASKLRPPIKWMAVSWAWLVRAELGMVRL